MRKGNKILVAIIVMLIILMLAGGAFAYLYIATDTFKTNKEMFFTYFAQLTSEEDGFWDKRIETFYKMKADSAYENSGEITIDVECPEESITEIIEKVNDLEISFEGQVDPKNQKVEQNIEIDYGNDVVLPINYIQDGKSIGLQTDQLSKKFIAVRIENLNELATNLGIENVDSIPDEFNFSELTKDIDITEADIEQLKQIYYPVLQDNLLKDNFSKTKLEKSEMYTLNLNGEQIKNIIIKMLEITKQNTFILDKLNEIMLAKDPEAEEIDEGIIDNLIDAINGESFQSEIDMYEDIDTDEETYEDSELEEDTYEEDTKKFPDLKLTLVQSDKKLNQIIIQSGENTISIKKNNLEDGVKYSINCEIKEPENEIQAGAESLIENETLEHGQANILFDMQYVGLDTLTNIQENYEFGFDVISSRENMKYTYKIDTNTMFNEDVSIEELDKDNAIYLNDYDESQLTPFLTQVGNRLLAINKKQMEELGLEEYENPILYSNPISLYVLLSLNMFNEATDSINNSNLSQFEMEMLNDKFIQYEGEEQSSSDVKSLIDVVQNHNANDEAVEVTVTLDGIEISDKDDVISGKTYNIEVIYNVDGFVEEMQVTTND